VKYLLLADIHASERPPSSCTASYMDDLFDLLYQTVNIAEQAQVAAVIWAGDVFHSKAPSRVSHRLMQRMLQLLGYYPCPVYVVPGNHDMQNDRLDTLADTQPLGVLVRSGKLRPLIGWMADAQGSGPVFGVPWLQHWDDESVIGALAGFRGSPQVADTSRHFLVVTHAPLYPEGRELQYEFYPARSFATAMGTPACVFYGHVHEPHGTWSLGITVETSQGIDNWTTAFCNNGALSRGSLHEYNLTRQVGVTIWDSETGQFTFLPLKARPAEEVFRLREAGQVADTQRRLDDFLASVGSTSLDVMSAETVVAHIRSLGLPAGDAALAEELIGVALHDGPS
jgi:Icc-related predicted phosphoesterase